MNDSFSPEIRDPILEIWSQLVTGEDACKPGVNKHLSRLTRSTQTHTRICDVYIYKTVHLSHVVSW